MNGKCALCEREGTQLTKHHLLPKEEGGTVDNIVLLCEACHRQIHALYINKELSVRLNTIEKLKVDSKINKYIKFIKKQPASKKVKISKSLEIKSKRR
ncbi:HNH endonuclease [Clostridium lacusfryxellense]|uniref:HNH endonuclease n=1 Tax=Clostridium lacusfryxellense TaxID=205328 RepID=UPI001C0E4C55|nr:HNH endonuclease [Clostridium lacusfryxellense]MBU3112308.1 HNH endonuclease [Clostridium lacusfryxellense]